MIHDLAWARTAERAAAEAAAKAKRAEAKRKAVAEAEKIVAIWNARQAGGRAVVAQPFLPNRSANGRIGLEFLGYHEAT
jgi:hypothetical protein